MNIVNPWIPTIDDNVVPPLRRLAPVIENEELPTMKHSPRWVRVAVRAGAGSNPNAERPLWETVLGLWRLSQVESCEEDDGEDAIWAEHVKAWLVRRTISLGWSRDGSNLRL